MSDFQPSRQQADLADVLELLLEKGIVINADIAVSIGDTQLLGVQLRAAIASFETAAKYGLAFPEGTDMERLAAAVDEPELAAGDRPNIPVDATRGVNVTPGGHSEPADDAAEASRSAGDERPADDGDLPHDEQSARLDEFDEISIAERDAGEPDDAETTREGEE